FSLKAGGEYLALVKPDGTTVVSQYDPFPAQTQDISYGVPLTSAAVFDVGQAAKIFIPPDGTLGTTWTGINFDDSSWQSGTTGVGFGSGFSSLIGTNVQSQMLNLQSSAYIRIPFNISNPNGVDGLTL